MELWFDDIFVEMFDYAFKQDSLKKELIREDLCSLSIQSVKAQTGDSVDTEQTLWKCLNFGGLRTIEIK